MQSFLQHYLEEYKRITAPCSITWDKARQSAFDDLMANGLPTIQNESWRYSARAPILNQPFKMGLSESLEKVDSLALQKSEQPSVRILCVNGRFRLPSLPLPAGLEIEPIAHVMEYAPALLTSPVFAEARRLGSGFAALNTLFAQEGIRIKVQDGYEIVPIIEICYLFLGLSASKVAPTMLCTRNDIEVGANSTLKLLEYAGMLENRQAALSIPSLCSNMLTTAVLKPASKLRWAQSLAIPNDQAYVGQLTVQQHEDSLFQSESLAQGGKLVRQTLSVDLKGAGAGCQLRGLSGVKEQQQIDHHLIVNHQAGHTQSDIHYRGVADGQGRLVFSGEVKAEVGIQKMNSNQGNYNLLLSDQAEIDTKPRLRLSSDDIQCTHGATVGYLDANALFYLQSRGLCEQTARMMLTRAFSEVIWSSMSLLWGADKRLLDNFLEFIKQRSE